MCWDNWISILKNGSYSQPHTHTHKKNKFQVDFRYECEKQIVTKVLKDTLREYLHELGVRKNILKGRKCTNHKGKD